MCLVMSKITTTYVFHFFQAIIIVVTVAFVQVCFCGDCELDYGLAPLVVFNNQ